MFRGPVCLQDVGGCGVERATDDLLDASGVQVYTGTKTRHCVVYGIVMRVEGCCGGGVE